MRRYFFILCCISMLGWQPAVRAEESSLFNAAVITGLSAATAWLLLYPMQRRLERAALVARWQLLAGGTVSVQDRLLLKELKNIIRARRLVRFTSAASLATAVLTKVLWDPAFEGAETEEELFAILKVQSPAAVRAALKDPASVNTLPLADRDECNRQVNRIRDYRRGWLVTRAEDRRRGAAEKACGEGAEERKVIED